MIYFRNCHENGKKLHQDDKISKKVQKILKIFKTIWEGKLFPKDWQIALKNHVHQRQYKKYCNDCRGITISSTVIIFFLNYREQNYTYRRRKPLGKAKSGFIKESLQSHMFSINIREKTQE